MIGLFTVEEYPGKSKCPIIIFGAGIVGQHLVECYELQYMEYNVVYFVDNDKNKWNHSIVVQGSENIMDDNLYCKRKIQIISVDEMRTYCNLHEDCIIILAVGEKFDKEVYQQIMNLGIRNKVIEYGMFIALCIREYVDLHIKKYDCNLAYQYYQQYYNFVNDSMVKGYRPLVQYLDKNSSFVTVVGPPKTGNNTILKALHNQRILTVAFHNGSGFWEKSSKSKWMELVKSGCKKFVIGLREPISQNVSLMFNEIINMFSLGVSDEQINNLDAQELFSKLIEPLAMGYEVEDTMLIKRYEIEGESEAKEHFIQNYCDGMIKSVLGIDVYSVDFDQEKGYGIGEGDDGKQFFIYQIEKLAGLEKEMAEFLGIEKICFQKENNGLKKYYSKEYHIFLQNFTLSKNYFDFCYNHKYVKKFYSNEDVERFKKRWEEHIL